MTKREICERLVSYYVIMGLKLPDASDLRTLLDLSAPVEEASKAEEKHPGILVDKKGENPPRCLRCGLDAEVVSYIGRGEEWACCPKCGCAYRIKREKDEK